MSERLSRTNFRGDWTSETWAWNPAHGRWSPKHGRPKGCVFLEVSTDGLPRQDAYDFWRETVFYHFDADREKPTRGTRFCAYAKGLVAARGEFYAFRSDGVSGHRTLKRVRQDGGDDLELGLVLAGTRLHQPVDDTPYTAGPGNPYLYDAANPSRVIWTAHRGLYLKLRRRMVEDALGGRTAPLSVLSRQLRASRLWPFLQAQTTLLAQNMSALSNVERGMVLDQTIDLALLTLRTLSPDLQELEETGLTRQGLFVAAQRFIAANLGDPELNVLAVANAVGCSRATLYRAFAENELTVAGYIREQRLQLFFRLLQAADPCVSIATLAERCGFFDVSKASAKFRQRFGMSPSDVRHEPGLSMLRDGLT